MVGYLYKDIVLLFIKILQKNGLKESSEIIVKKVFCFIKKLTKKSPIGIFKSSLKNGMFYSELRLVKISGVNYKVPFEVKPKRQKNLALKSIIYSSSKKNHSYLTLNLMKEVIDTCNSVSNTVKLCDDMHKIAESNKLYLQYRY